MGCGSFLWKAWDSHVKFCRRALGVGTGEANSNKPVGDKALLEIFSHVTKPFRNKVLLCNQTRQC